MMQLKPGQYKGFNIVKARTMTELQRAYVACAIDTEGSLIMTWGKNKTSANGIRPILRIDVNNTNLAFVQVVQNMVHAGTINKGPSGVGFRKMTCYVLSIRRMADVLVVLKQVQPYLVIKRPRADEMIEWLEERLQVKGMDTEQFPPRYFRASS
jgi:hypothetical protein